jgi:hypothetical protein
MIAILQKLSEYNFILFLSAEYDPVADEPVSVQDDEELQVFWLHARPVTLYRYIRVFVLVSPI